jgi:hypothetical protein
MARLILSLDNLTSASGLRGLLEVLVPLGTFILPVHLLVTVGTLISPQFLPTAGASQGHWSLFTVIASAFA